MGMKSRQKKSNSVLDPGRAAGRRQWRFNLRTGRVHPGVDTQCSGRTQEGEGFPPWLASSNGLRWSEGASSPPAQS